MSNNHDLSEATHREFVELVTSIARCVSAQPDPFHVNIEAGFKAIGHHGAHTGNGDTTLLENLPKVVRDIAHAANTLGKDGAATFYEGLNLFFADVGIEARFAEGGLIAPTTATEPDALTASEPVNECADRPIATVQSVTIPSRVEFSANWELEEGDGYLVFNSVLNHDISTLGTYTEIHHSNGEWALVHGIALDANDDDNELEVNVAISTDEALALLKS